MTHDIEHAIETAGHHADDRLLAWLDTDTDPLTDEAMADAPDAWFDTEDASDDTQTNADDTDTPADTATNPAATANTKETTMSDTQTQTTATEPAPKKKTAKADAPPRFCLSGSGNQVSGKSRFRPGADAATKGYLQRIARATPRDGDPTMAHLVETFVANTEDTALHARVQKALTGWDEGPADFENEAALHAHPAFVLATAINPAWSKFVTPAPVRKPRKRARKAVTRRVGRWDQTGHTEGRGADRVFVYTTKSGEEKRVPYANTADVPEASD